MRHAPRHAAGGSGQRAGGNLCVARSGKAIAFAAVHEPDEAARAAVEALGIARNAGSERIVRMVMPVAEAVTPYRRSLSSAAQLHALLAGQES